MATQSETEPEPGGNGMADPFCADSLCRGGGVAANMYLSTSGEFGRPGRRSSVPIPTPNDSGGGYVGWHKGCQKIAFSMRISDMYSNLP